MTDLSWAVEPCDIIRTIPSLYYSPYHAEVSFSFNLDPRWYNSSTRGTARMVITYLSMFSRITLLVN